MSLNRISTERSFCCFSPFVENIIDKKVRGIALGIFERIIDILFHYFSSNYRQLSSSRLNVITPPAPPTSPVTPVSERSPILQREPTSPITLSAAPTEPVVQITQTEPTAPTVEISPALMEKIQQATQENSPPISINTVKSRQRGCLYGQTEGDAAGFKANLRARERETLPKDKSPQWSDHTDQALLVVNSEYFKATQAVYINTSVSRIFSEQLQHWIHQGSGGFMGRFGNRYRPVSRENQFTLTRPGALSEAVSRRPNFITTPEQAAYEVWFGSHDEMRRRFASNEALLRTTPVGLIHYKDLNETVAITRSLCKVTHADPRAVASSVAVSVAIALLMRGCQDITRAIHHASEIGKQVLVDEMTAVAHQENMAEYWESNKNAYLMEFDYYMNAANWADLQLDQNDVSYTYKCMGAAFLALKTIVGNREELEKTADAPLPPDTLDRFTHLPLRFLKNNILQQKGDVSANLAGAGALLGAYLGSTTILNAWMISLNDFPLLTQTNEIIHNLSQR